jgi:hypothetical protein
MQKRILDSVGTVDITTADLDKEGDLRSRASWSTEEAADPPCAGQATYAPDAGTRREDDYAQRLKHLEARERGLDIVKRDLATLKRDLESRERDLEAREKTLQFEKATHDMAEERLKLWIAGSRSGQASVKDQQESARSEAASATTEEASAGIEQASASSEQGSRKSSEPTREQLQREAVLRQNLSLWRLGR